MKEKMIVAARRVCLASAGVGALVASTASNAAIDIADEIADVTAAASQLEALGLAFLAATMVVIVIGFIRRNAGRV